MPAAAKQVLGRLRLVACMQSDYHRADFFADLGAGVTVVVVALPLAMAFAIASGVPPQAAANCSARAACWPTSRRRCSARRN